MCVFAGNGSVSPILLPAGARDGCVTEQAAAANTLLFHNAQCMKGVRTMLSETMQVALNNQLNAELFSSYLYLSMAANLESKNLKGMSHWFQVQAQEEMIHALKF